MARDTGPSTETAGAILRRLGASAPAKFPCKTDDPVDNWLNAVAYLVDPLVLS